MWSDRPPSSPVLLLFLTCVCRFRRSSEVLGFWAGTATHSEVHSELNTVREKADNFPGPLWPRRGQTVVLFLYWVLSWQSIPQTPQATARTLLHLHPGWKFPVFVLKLLQIFSPYRPAPFPNVWKDTGWHLAEVTMLDILFVPHHLCPPLSLLWTLKAVSGAHQAPLLSG